MEQFFTDELPKRVKNPSALTGSWTITPMSARAALAVASMPPTASNAP
jgi:hypothetical protein